MKKPQGPLSRKGKRVIPSRNWVLLERDGYYCCVCGDTRLSNLTVDHIIKRCDGGSNELSNLQVLCKHCHAYKDGQKVPFPKRILQLESNNRWEKYYEAILKY